MRNALFTVLALAGSTLLAQSPDAPTSDMSPPEAVIPSPKTDDAEEVEEEKLDEAVRDQDPLAFSQNELQNNFPGGLAFNIGPVMPWSNYGVSLLWRKINFIQTLSLGAGDYKFSDNYKERNYNVDTDSQSIYYGLRWFFLGFGPIYVEPFFGAVRWSGSIKPNGYDNVNDTLASSLNSRFDITGASLGANLGIMWIFQNGIFLDYNFLNLSGAGFIKTKFTTNTEEAKKNVKKELAGPLTMSNLHLRVGYSLAL